MMAIFPFARALVTLVLFVCGMKAHAHGTGPFGYPVSWETQQVSSVTALADGGRVIEVNGRRCLRGKAFGFKVRDDFAYDIDETVWIDAEFEGVMHDTLVHVAYNDIHGAWPKDSGTFKIPGGGNRNRYKQSFALDRARFAHLGVHGSDFSLSADEQYTLCKLRIRRSFRTPPPPAFGRVVIKIVDEQGRPTPVRMGIYDASGKLPLPSDDALPIKSFVMGRTRVIPAFAPWPMPNHSVFYVNGSYHARLPAGDYDLVASKGLEYRHSRLKFTVKPGITTPIVIALDRWTNMPQKGWFSGEDHIHYAREDKRDDRELLLMLQAEDLTVGNILTIGNLANSYMSHYDCNHVQSETNSLHLIAPGQEDPRTSILGHTIQMNIDRSIRDPDNYLLYHKVFEETRRQGGPGGYAHVNGRSDIDPLYVVNGLPIDVPFGLVDFIEIMDYPASKWTSTSIWFDFLNLGFKISPTAGTDWPFGSVPGTARNFVLTGKPFSQEGWFEGLRAGRTFVTTGPILEFKINGRDIGSQLRVKRGEAISIIVSAMLNPDLGKLSKIELIEQGDVVKSQSLPLGSHDLVLRYDVPATHGTWYVVRAEGATPDIVAISAPIFVLVDGQSFWKPDAVPAIVDKLKTQMSSILGKEPVETELTDGNGSGKAFRLQWNRQRAALTKRIEAATFKYDEIKARAVRK